MRKALKIIIGALGAFICLIGCFMLYFTMGPSTIGPKTDVDTMCSELVGMDLTEAKALYPDGSGIDFLEPNSHEIFSMSRGEFLCVCEVAVDENDVIASYDVPCLD